MIVRCCCVGSDAAANVVSLSALASRLRASRATSRALLISCCAWHRLSGRDAEMVAIRSLVSGTISSIAAKKESGYLIGKMGCDIWAEWGVVRLA